MKTARRTVIIVIAAASALGAGVATAGSASAGTRVTASADRALMAFDRDLLAPADRDLSTTDGTRVTAEDDWHMVTAQVASKH